MKIKKISRQLTYWMGVVAVGLIVGTALQIASAWVNPPAAPPDNNVGAPINTGNISQTKSGGLNVTGDVGIGNSSPAKKLDVTGDIHATGDICTDLEGGKCLSKGFGDMVKIDGFSGGLAQTGNIEAQKDGFAFVEYMYNFTGETKYLFACVSNNSGGGCQKVFITRVEANRWGGSMSFPVKKGEWWRIYAMDWAGNTCNWNCVFDAWWTPLGSN